MAALLSEGLPTCAGFRAYCLEVPGFEGQAEVVGGAPVAFVEGLGLPDPGAELEGVSFDGGGGSPSIRLGRAWAGGVSECCTAAEDQDACCSKGGGYDEELDPCSEGYALGEGHVAGSE